MLATGCYGYIDELLKNSDTKNYLEIGVFEGDGLAKLAANHPEKTLIGIDPFIEDGCTTHITHVGKNNALTSQKQKTYNNIRGLTNVFLFEMTSQEFCMELGDSISDDLDINVVFIDGNHSYDFCKHDSELALKLIGQGTGYIIFDDLQVYDVKRAFNEFQEKYKERIEDVNLINGKHYNAVIKLR